MTVAAALPIAWRLTIRPFPLSLLTSGFALCFLVALASSLETRALTSLWQRLMLVASFLWCAIIGRHAFDAPGR